MFTLGMVRMRVAKSGEPKTRRTTLHEGQCEPERTPATSEQKRRKARSEERGLTCAPNRYLAPDGCPGNEVDIDGDVAPLMSGNWVLIQL
jgi:hypothetical protein